MVLWSLVMTVIIFWQIVSPSSVAIVAGFGVTALFAIYLGWRRRVGATFIAPAINWLFAWFPTMIACMIHFGALKGFFIGLLTITFGWIAIGFVEFVWLWMVAMVVRSVRGPGRIDPIVIIDPDRN
jgi:hypothetical protein